MVQPCLSRGEARFGRLDDHSRDIGFEDVGIDLGDGFAVQVGDVDSLVEIIPLGVFG